MKNKNKFLLILMSVFFMMTQGLYAQVNNVTQSTSHMTLQDAITSANGGDLLMLTADLDLGAATHTINKPLIIDGDGHEIKLGANAKNIRFEAASNGSVVKNVNFLKTVQEKTFMIYIAADNLTFDNNTYTGQKSGFLGLTKENKVFEVGYNKENLVFKNSTFKDLHLIAYVNGKSKGAILNNTYSNTSGWNLTYNTAFEIEGNTWNSLANFVNIIEDGASTDPQENFYTCRIDMMVAENTVQKFRIDNKVTGKTCAITNVTKSTNWEDMETAIAYAQADDELRLNKDITQTETIVLNKKLTINQNNKTITTNGGNYVYKLVPNNSHGTTIKNGKISKTDHQTQQLIFVQANDVTIDNIDFEGVYDENVDPGEVSRGFEVVGNLNNLVIQNCSFKNLRQPGYINPKTTGQILNNHVEGTRGWVMVANTEFNFNGNTWTDNARDISFIDDVPAVDPSENYYTCSKIRAIKHFNNDPTIGNELLIGDCTDMFITEWITDNGTITIPTSGTGYNYDITWTNMTTFGAGDGAAMNVTDGDYLISNLENGDLYEVTITGDFPRIYFNNSGDKDKIIAVTQWGDIEWTSMNSAFAGATNLEVTAADTPDLSNVEDMYYMFRNAKSLTGSHGNWAWNTENVTNMSATFFGADNFNGDISGWNTGNVTNMASMFADALSFNQDIGAWNTENVVNMRTLFRNARSFDQNLGNWNLNSLTNAQGMFNIALSYGINCDMLSATIQGWAANPNTPSGIKLGVDNRQVTNLVNAIDVKHLVNDKNWEITGLIAGCDTWNDESTFETQWLVANDGTITVPTVGAGYNYDILWTNLSNPSVPASADRGVTNSYTISGLNEGDTIEISISGDFPRIYFNNSGDKDKIIAVTQWGDIEWTSMNNAFAGATNLEVTAKDTPDLSNVEDMFYMFKGAETLTGSQGNWNWNTENVTNMSAAFFQASNFNGDISGWNTENVTNMASMFANATSFNQDIGNWNTGKVTNMKTLFKDANSFDQDLGSWNLKSLTNAQGMFNVISESYGLNCDMFSATLEGWAANSNTPSGIVLGSFNKVADANAFANSILSLGAMGWTFPGLSTMPCDDVVALSGNIDDLVEVNSDLTMTLYPNPTDGVFTLSTETGTSYMVLDIYGRTILNGQVINTKAVVDLTSYPRGIYYVKVGEKVERIVVK